MRKLIYFALIALAALFASPAAADVSDNNYVSLQVGGVYLQNSSFSFANGDYAQTTFSNGFYAGVAAGHRFHPLTGFRAELEVSYRRNALDTTLVAGKFVLASGNNSDYAVSKSLMANAIWDLNPRNSWIIPYLGIGAGVSNVEYELVGNSFSQTVFAYQGIAGVDFHVTNDTRFEVSYRYFATQDAPGEMGYNTHNLVAGLKFEF